MTSPKRAATYIGRIGALAVTLGVGHALASGTAVASADSADQGSAGPTAQESTPSTTAPASRRAPRSTATTRPAQQQRAAAVEVRRSAVSPVATAAQAPASIPTDSSAPWTQAVWTRRDLAGSGARSVAARAAAASSAATGRVPAAAAAATPPTSLGSAPLGWVTGQRNTAYPGFGWTQTNNTSWANVYGTDVGVMWFNGENAKTQLAFGDTFSGPNMSGNWRSNVLLLSTDTQLYDGLTLERSGPANQFIPAARNQVFFIGS